MSNSNLPLSDTPSLAQPGEAACRHARPLRAIGRPDSLTAQRIEVGIVLQAMLGTTAATDYFDKHDVDPALALRVLCPIGRRRGSHDANGIRT